MVRGWRSSLYTVMPSQEHCQEEYEQTLKQWTSRGFRLQAFEVVLDAQQQQLVISAWHKQRWRDGSLSTERRGGASWSSASVLRRLSPLHHHSL
jgi:hypothetical protein